MPTFGRSDVRTFERELSDGFTRDERHLAFGQHPGAVIRHIQKKVLDVYDVALHVHGQYLPRSPKNDLVSHRVVSPPQVMEKRRVRR